ncbi:sugar ABC transporter ATP-binding protein [Hydrogenophaga sp.]|jgi:ribose transport system ATP-binding protein|uniref:sugar ABC transporter ATP-binding protein n=1 Tax=Hydrogenophaga sp. TaxID=1904254 RepID=UPI002722F8FB|nr:sugar ABC transporter ATP-binding protein [Hydrogenophaga sp.]MDO9250878.1 sugar ABC transporter ATP-binding protein [Hydrogenophaga sp.]MDP3324958.1 sugar ABC transporter ATP-binding protein [Hydrogenophaga sp.]MDP3885273.1 sugar ABC transporter ATP-binding protein [Hydrogenophaga sp.]
MPVESVLLQTIALSKQYPGVLALEGMDFDLRAGEVHVLFGENGAGKSTLISLLAGANTPTSGEIHMHGKRVNFDSVHEARLLGVSAVFQEFSLIPTLSVAQNLSLGDEPARHGLLDRVALQARARSMLSDLDFELDPRALVSDLTRAQQQMVEIAKGLRGEVSVLILDEPTASLTDKEAQHLFALVDRLKAQGVGIVYISHRMQEITQIADRITVLRDGRKITTVDAGAVTPDQLIELMSGRPIEQIYPKIEHCPGDVVLEVDGLVSPNGVRNASITVRRGEVVGLAGLVGCGKSELFRAVYGLDPVSAGSVRFKGQPRTGASTRQLLREGLFYLPPDRKGEGLVLGFSSRANITLPLVSGPLRGRGGSLRRKLGRRLSSEAAKSVELSASNLEKPVALLSGGNQQKVMFGKGMTREASLYVFDEPTVGVDIGTRSALYQVIQKLCEGGAAVVVISSDLPEVLHLSHRVYVMRHGEMAGELSGAAITEPAVLNLFFGPSERNP